MDALTERKELLEIGEHRSIMGRLAEVTEKMAMDVLDTFGKLGKPVPLLPDPTHSVMDGTATLENYQALGVYDSIERVGNKIFGTVRYVSEETKALAARYLSRSPVLIPNTILSDSDEPVWTLHNVAATPFPMQENIALSALAAYGDELLTAPKQEAQPTMTEQTETTEQAPLLLSDATLAKLPGTGSPDERVALLLSELDSAKAETTEAKTEAEQLKTVIKTNSEHIEALQLSSAKADAEAWVTAQSAANKLQPTEREAALTMSVKHGAAAAFAETYRASVEARQPLTPHGSVNVPKGQGGEQAVETNDNIKQLALAELGRKDENGKSVWKADFAAFADAHPKFAAALKEV